MDAELQTTLYLDDIDGVNFPCLSLQELDELHPGAGFKERTHVQIAVPNPDCIIAYFRVAGV